MNLKSGLPHKNKDVAVTDAQALPKNIRPGGTMVGNVSWLLAQNITARLVGFGSQIILAWILLPSDFASFALAGTITSIVALIANFGTDDVLLQRQRTIKYWTTSAFLISLVLGVVSMVLVVAAAPFAAAMYQAPILRTILPIMALSMPLGALSTVPEVKIRAALNFRFLARYSIMEFAVSQALIVALALSGFGVFSFVFPAPIVAAARALVFWIVAKPEFGRMRIKQLGMMGSSSAVVFGTKIITAFVGQGDYFILGLIASKPVVGSYYFAFKLASQPIQLLAGNVSNVLFPTLAGLWDDPERQRRTALNASRILSFLVMPYCFTQAAIARPLLTLAFGTKWEAAIPLVQILSVGLAFDAVSWVAGSLLSARGEFRRAFVYSCIFSPLFFIAVAIGGNYFSATGVAVAVSAFYALLAPVYSYAVFSSLGVSFGEVAKIYIGSTVFAASAVIIAIKIASETPSGDLLQSIIIGTLGISLYLVQVRLFMPATYRQFLVWIRATWLSR
jgi:PST family polysaccharide transporter